MEVTISPIQMKQLLYTKIFIEPFFFKSDEEIWAPNYNFDGVSIKTNLGCALAEGQESNPKNFKLRLILNILNDEEESKESPYNVEIEADAWFEISDHVKAEARENLICVNGGSMMIGSIRELLTQLTARSVFGPMTLPSLRLLPNRTNKKEDD